MTLARTSGRRIWRESLFIWSRKPIRLWVFGASVFPWKKEELFKTQLRAILRAGAYGEVSILYPLITSVEEFKRAKALLKEVEEELADFGIPCGKVRQGVMIETPAAAVLSDLLAAEAEFFSIGTNDLSQYTMAVDRENPRTEEYFDSHHPALTPSHPSTR